MFVNLLLERMDKEGFFIPIVIIIARGLCVCDVVWCEDHAICSFFMDICVKDKYCDFRPGLEFSSILCLHYKEQVTVVDKAPRLSR